MPVIYDASAWPIATLQMIGRLTESEEEEFIAFTMLPAQRQAPYVGIIDLQKASTPSVRFLREQANAMKRHEEALSRYCRGVAFAAQSSMLRGAVRAVLHLQTLPCPTRVVGDVDEAWRWAEQHLAPDAG